MAETDQLEFLFTGNNAQLKTVIAENENLVEKMNAKVASSSTTTKTAETALEKAVVSSSTALTTQVGALDSRAAAAVNTARTVVSAEQAIQKEAFFTAEYMKHQNELGNAQLAAMQKTWSVNAYTPTGSYQNNSQARALKAAEDKVNAERLAQSQQMEATLAADRAKWAGDAIRTNETIAVSRLAISKADKVVENSAKDLIKAEKGIEAATTDVNGAFTSAVASFTGLAAGGGELSAVMAVLTNPVGLAAVAVGAVAVGAGAGAIALDGMASSAGEFGAHIQDMSDRTGLSANNLLALDTAAKSSGTSLERLISSVSIFEKRLGNADAATDRVSRGLKKWGIDTQDPNKGLEQIIEKLAEFPEGTRRTQVAMDIFGIAGKDFAAITKTMEGSLVNYREELAKMGIELGGNSITAAAKFHEEQVRMSQQWDVLKFKIESAATPIVEKWLKGISDWMTKNQKEIIEWGTSFVTHAGEIINSIASVAAYVSQIAPIVIPVIWAYKGISGMNVAAGQQEYTRETEVKTKKGNVSTVPEGVDATEWYRMQSMQEGSYPTQGVAGPAKVPDNPFERQARGGHKGGGTDPARHDLQMEQERLKQAVSGFQFEEYQWEDMLKKKQTSLETYTKIALQIETDRSKVTLAALEKEYDAAGRLKKPDQREEKQLEVRGRIEQERQRLIKASNDLIFNYDQDAVAKERVNQESRLSILEVTSRQRSDRVRDDVEYRTITEEQGAQALTDIQLRLNERKRELLEFDLSQQREGSVEYLRIQGQLAVSESEHAALFEESQRRIRDARRKDLEDARRFSEDMRNLDKVIIDSRISTARILLEHQINTGQLSNPNLQRGIQEFLDKQEENARFEQEQAEIRSRWRVELEKKTYDEIIQINERYLQIVESAEEAHQARIKVIQERKLEEMHQAVQRLASNAASSIMDAGELAIEGKGREALLKIGSMLKDTFKNALERQLEQGLTAVFDKLSTNGGIFGGIFEAITGITLGGKDDTQQGALNHNTSSTETNTQAINALTMRLSGMNGLGGGMGGFDSTALFPALRGLLGGGSSGGGKANSPLDPGTAGKALSGLEEHRRFGGPVEAGQLYQVHDQEYFRPSQNGLIVRNDSPNVSPQPAREPERIIVAFGDEAISQALDAHGTKPSGRRAQVINARWNRKAAKVSMI